MRLVSWLVVAMAGLKEANSANPAYLILLASHVINRVLWCQIVEMARLMMVKNVIPQAIISAALQIVLVMNNAKLTLPVLLN